MTTINEIRKKLKLTFKAINEGKCLNHPDGIKVSYCAVCMLNDLPLIRREATLAENKRVLDEVKTIIKKYEKKMVLTGENITLLGTKTRFLHVGDFWNMMNELASLRLEEGG